MEPVCFYHHPMSFHNVSAAMVDLTLEPRALLVALINSGNPDNVLQVSDVDFGEPQAIDEQNRNTSIVLTAKADSPWDTYQVFYYNRMNLGVDVIPSLSNEFTYVEDMTEQDVLDLINARYGINLTTDECTVSEIEGPGEITVTAKSTALNYIGSAAIVLTGDGPVKIPLDEAFPNNILDGLTYVPPVGD